MFNKILVSIDGSEASMNALKKAIELNQSLNAEIYILYVQRHHSNLESSMHALPANPKVMADNRRDYAKQVVADAKSSVLEGNPNVSVRGFVVTGPVARTIASFAKDKSIDLIVLGSRGHGDQEGFMLGSVSHKVASITDVPVLLI